jgi:hypothetical protein
VGRVIGLPVRTAARPFATVAVPTVATLGVGLLLMDALAGLPSPVAQLVIGGIVVVVLNLVLLRTFAAGVVRDGLSILPLPERMSAPVRRALRLEVKAA